MVVVVVVVVVKCEAGYDVCCMSTAGQQVIKRGRLGRAWVAIGCVEAPVFRKYREGAAL